MAAVKKKTRKKTKTQAQNKKKGSAANSDSFQGPAEAVSGLMEDEKVTDAAALEKQAAEENDNDGPEEVLADGSDAEEVSDILCFRLTNEEYGVDLLKVKEIIRMIDITHVPKMSSMVKGILSLRGTIIPIYDLRKRLSLSELSYGGKSRIIIMSVEKGLMGFVVDEVKQVAQITISEIEKPPDMLSEENGSPLRGVSRIDNRLIILLDIEKAIALGC